ncbi:MAG TPA: hypothetical protein PLB55_03260 [Prosthecobacter sp.]|nr:hypothetical protein [Prosthecobacter sp.]
MSRILLLPHGTIGDVLPLIWIGRQMMQRGHQATMIWVDAYENQARKAGLDFISLQDEGEFEKLSRSSSLWCPRESMRQGHAFADRCTKKYMAAAHEHITRHGKPDLLIAPMITFAARLLREVHGMPFISTNLQPVTFISAYDLPAGLPAVRWLRKLPVPLRKLVLAAASGDFQPLPVLRQCCIDHGVKPPRSLRRDWYHSPDGVLALFPPWYARPQPDWPANTFQWDFPLEDMAVERPLAPALQAFLESGPPPVVFSLGSATIHVRQFFETAMILTARLGLRAVFVTEERPSIPASLSSSVHVTSYAAYSTLLPRSVAFAHHGGTGTMASCLAVGCPQLITPLAFSQPDSAERVERLGVGLRLDIQKFTPLEAEPLLRRLLEDTSIRQKSQKCAEQARRLREQHPITELVAWLEKQMSCRTRS